jgi:hypothetical protein
MASTPQQPTLNHQSFPQQQVPNNKLKQMVTSLVQQQQKQENTL